MSALFPIPASLRSELDLLGGRTLRGHVVDLVDLACRHVVDVLADGLPIGLMRADLFDDGLGDALIGDGCYGFCFDVPDAVLSSAATIEVRLANTRRQVGRTIALTGDPRADPADLRSGCVAWIGGPWLEGRLRVGGSGETRVMALVDGRVVAETMSRDWTHVGLGDTFGVARAFRLHLPDDLADGRVRRIEVVAGDGTVLRGSPCVHVGFKDGLVRFIEGAAAIESEAIRAETFDALCPPSVPLGAVERWRRQFGPGQPPAASAKGQSGIVLVGPGDLEASLASLEAQGGAAWTAAVLPDRAGLRFEPDDLRDFLSGEGRSCDLLVFAATGTQFDPHALAHLRDALDGAPEAVSVYCDHLVAHGGQDWPLLHPAFDYERCLEQGAFAALFAMRREAVLAALEAGADSLYRVFNAPLDRRDEMSVPPLHCPMLLGRVPEGDADARAGDLLRATAAHLAARGVEARVSAGEPSALPNVRVARPLPGERLSVVIPGGFDPERLIATLRMLQDTARYLDPEIVVANQSGHDVLRLRLDDAGFTHVQLTPGSGDANPSRAINRAVRAASGALVLLLGNGIEGAGAGWLDELLGRLREPEVGAVGAALFWPSGVVRSAGYVLGPELSAAPACGDRIAGEAGYAGLLDVAHECSAVSAEALATRRALFLEAGGLDEVHVPFDFADVDFCLKLRQRGLRIVVAPHARLQGPGPASRPESATRRTREAQSLRYRWGEALLSDPFHNPNLALDRQPFSALAWPPRSRAPRLPERPTARPIPPGL